MITFGPCDHPVRPDGCRVCWLMRQPETCYVSPRATPRDRRYYVVTEEIIAQDNAWSRYVGDVEMGSHLTLEQRAAIELSMRREANRGAYYENVDRLRMDGHYDAMDRRRDREWEGTVERICPPNSRRPVWLINWMLAQRQKQFVERALLAVKGSGLDVSTAADFYDVFGIDDGGQ